MSRGRDNKGFGLKSREGHRGEKMANSETAQGYVQSRMAVPCLLRMSFVPDTLNEGLRMRLVHRPHGRLQRWGELGVKGGRLLGFLFWVTLLPSRPMCSLCTSASSQKSLLCFLGKTRAQ